MKEINSNGTMGIGVALGIALGAAFGNLGLGIVFGVVIGAAWGARIDSQNKNKSDDKQVWMGKGE